MKEQIRYEVPPSVRAIVVAECWDYHRRKQEMEFVPKNSLFYRTAVSRNEIILSAAKEVWGDNIDFCETAISDIGNRRGWINSTLGTVIGEAAFNRRKYKIIRLVAIRMNLMFTT